MSDSTRRIVAVPVTLVTAAGLAVVVAEIFRGVVFGRSHADPAWLILGAAWVAAMLAATVALWTGADRRSRPALWTGAAALVAGAAVLASGLGVIAWRVLLFALAALLAAGSIAAGRPGPRNDREGSS